MHAEESLSGGIVLLVELVLVIVIHLLCCWPLCTGERKVFVWYSIIISDY